MRKRVFALLLCFTLPLSACGQGREETPEPAPTLTATPAPTPTQTPEPEPTPEEVTELWGFPIDDTHSAFEVPTGGKLGTVVVTVGAERGDTPPIGSVTLSVWNSSDLLTPIQTMVLDACWRNNWGEWNEVVDANFDGYMDFGIEYTKGATAESYWSYWLWNEENGRFEEELSIGQAVYFDAERKIVCSRWSGFDPAKGGQSCMRWEEGKLVTIRTIYHDGPIYCNEDKGLQGTLTVKDNINGILTEVFQLEADVDVIMKEAEKWQDLNYHGE